MKRKSKAIAKPSKATKIAVTARDGYDDVLSGVVDLLESARRTSARATNAIMTATYWEVGRRIVECEQAGESRAGYGVGLLRQLSSDLRERYKRGFGMSNLKEIRRFFLAYRDVGKSQTVSGLFETQDFKPTNTPIGQKVSNLLANQLSTEIQQTPSAKSDPSAIFQTPSEKFNLRQISSHFPLPWSHYVRLLKVEKSEARRFYETEALRGGWSVRQLDRQISTLFYERTLASRNKAAMLEKGAIPQPGEILSPEQEIKDPLVLEFLGLKDEYSESDLENALVEKYEMPLPTPDEQHKIRKIHNELSTALVKQNFTTELDALLPSILDRAFNGEL